MSPQALGNLAAAAPEPAETSAPAPALTVDCVRSVAGVQALRSDYDQLQGATGNSLPFALHEWHVVWCRHFLRDEPGIVDRPLFMVARSPEGECAAILPLILTERRAGGLTVGSMALLGADPAITEIRSCLVRPGCEEAAAEVFHAALKGAHDWDWMQWTGQGEPFDAAIGRLRRLEWQPVTPCYLLDLPGTWEAFRGGLKRNIRESLRHCYNSLKRDGHEFRLVVASSPEEVAPALERLFVLHGLRAAMTGTVPHPNRFAAHGLRRFLLEVCAALSTRGVARVFELEVNGRIVASRVGFVVGDSLYLYYSGFDPAWSRYGVMTTTVAEAIKYSIALGLKTVNLSPGNDVSKTRWTPREVWIYGANEHSGRLRSRLMRTAYVKARSGRGLGAWLLRRLIPGQRDWR